MAKRFTKIAEAWKEAMINPELDRVKSEVRAALEEMKENPEGSDVTAALLERGLKGLRADLQELDISEDQWEQYEKAYERRFRVAITDLEKGAILKSPESLQLDAFVNDFASYAKLDEVIAESKAKKSKKPMNKFVQTIRDNSALFVGIGAGLMKWLSEGKEEEEKKEGKPSKLDAAAARADKAMGTAKDKAKQAKDKTKDKAKGATAAISGSDDSETPAGGAGADVGGGGESPSDSPRATVEQKPKPLKVGRIGKIEIDQKAPINYKLPKKYRKKPKSFKEFKKTLAELGPNRHYVNAYIAFAYAAGYRPPGYEKLHNVKMEAKVDGKPMVLEYRVDNGVFLGDKGEDEKGKPNVLKKSVSGGAAQAIADMKGRKLLLPGMHRHVYEQAKRDGSTVTFRSGQDLADAAGYEGDFGIVMVHPTGDFTLTELHRREMKEKGIDPRTHLIAGGDKEMFQPRISSDRYDFGGGFYPNGDEVQKGKTNIHTDALASYNEATAMTRTYDPNSFRLNGKPITEEELMKRPDLLKAFGLTKPAGDGRYVIPENLKHVVEDGKDGDRAEEEGDKKEEEEKKAGEDKGGSKKDQEQKGDKKEEKKGDKKEEEKKGDDSADKQKDKPKKPKEDKK
jgi:hypothetical protein